MSAPLDRQSSAAFTEPEDGFADDDLLAPDDLSVQVSQYAGELNPGIPRMKRRHYPLYHDPLVVSVFAGAQEIHRVQRGRGRANSKLGGRRQRKITV
ncbi:unnamed protein product [Heligmosomoides polygyrus]|uniref:Transposase n=1 Tax=Heligmosomoides polygyrus TaxID=6339 RepID=A0A183G608_HELPZ|nr:unnamed protein product [Heligmosomoides polygyrus]